MSKVKKFVPKADWGLMGPRSTIIGVAFVALVIVLAFSR
jgi:hypothetical protein